MTSHGMLGRLLGLVVVGAVVALALGVAAPGIGHAQMLKCENDWLYEYDEMALRAAALRVLPKSAHVIVTHACRNPNWTYGFIETKKNTTAEGVQQWYQFMCRREAQPWKCDEPEFKQFYALNVNIEGISHPVELSFDEESSRERARLLASRAIQLYLDPTSQLPSCGGGEPKDSDRLRAKSHDSPLPAGENAIHINITKPMKDSVDLNDVQVRIDFRPSGDPVAYDAACWWQFIVVT